MMCAQGSIYRSRCQYVSSVTRAINNQATTYMCSTPLQEHQQKAAAQEEPEEPDEPEGNHQEMVDIAEQLGLEVAHDEESEEESEPPSKPASRNVSEITQSVNRVIEPKPEEKQLSKKVCDLANPHREHRFIEP